MKKITLSLMAVFSALIIFAQTPQAFKYQAVARNASGDILSETNVAFRISILQSSASGTNVYTETHNTTTNEFGLVNLEIGKGIIVSGNFSTINWGADAYFLQVEMDETGGNNYLVMGTSQLLSVPYSLFSERASSAEDDDWIENGDDLIMNTSGNVGIGTTTPEAKLEVSSMLRITPSALLEACTENLRGSMYFDEVLNEYCYCDGNYWKQIDGGGYCECPDNDLDGYDLCNPGDPYDTDGLPADCDDDDMLTYPGASELCDGIDNDCNDIPDDNLQAPPCPNQEGVCGGSVMSCGGTSGWIACDGSNYGPNYESIETSCDYLDNDCDGQIDEMCYGAPNVNSFYCNGGGCAIGTCDAGWADCNGSYSDGCEMNLNQAPNSCASPYFLGSHPGDEGSGCGFTDFSEYYLGSYFYRIYMFEDCTSLFNNDAVGIRATLTVPPGIDYDLYLYDDNCNLLDQSAGGGSPEYVEHHVNDTMGFDDSQYYKIEVRFYGGSSCNNWTLRIQSYSN